MITITVTAHSARPVALPFSATFDEKGGTIGRSPENTLVLLDPERKISRTHATVVFRDGSYLLRDQGSVVPVVVNERALGNGRESPLEAGDEIRIGAYTLKVSASAAAGTAAPPPQRPASTKPPVPDTAGASPASPAAMTEPVLSWASNAPAAPREGITTVILASAEDPGAEPVAPMQVPEQAAAATSAAPPAQQPAPPACAAPVGKEELLRALLAGAGLHDVEIPGGLTPELMHQLGRLLHEATRGLLDLLAARASTKREVRADMTVIVAADNNPLKFSPNMEAALTHLLVPRGRGFMPPLAAITDAYEDLHSHQLGFMAGMRSALAVVLARFNPEELERSAADRSMVDSFLPTNRKAKLWDLFGQLYGEISEEAESDFHALFGEEFLKAYREHAAKLPGPGSPAARR